MNYFYNEYPDKDTFLSTEESSHCIKVLRKKKGDQIHIINGKGAVFIAEILDTNFRKCSYKILDLKRSESKKNFHSHVAISPTKNHDRLEWFVEKSCELGIDEISIVSTKRTERKKVNMDRLERKTISALKQSKNLHKTQVNNILNLSDFLKSHQEVASKFIAFVDHENPKNLHKQVLRGTNTLVLIGPEGDFNTEEVDLAISYGFEKISLGNSILRTETAGVIATHTINMVNEW
ncbi:MAG: 16S rRNA (uracil1498-N3)-methyltransferase [Bacteroidia bacterium]|jgi:16S rRNA (uracil1498-N3)-methyltransferase